MDIDEIKQTIERQTGIPSDLLTGESIEENIAQAKALLVYKKEADAQRSRSTAEQFGEWMNACDGIEQPDIVGQALAGIEESARIEAGGYPYMMDGGEANYTPSMDSRAEFEAWIGRQMAFNPQNCGGWKPLLR